MRAIDPAIQVLPETDIDSAWDRFEVFEALHHSMQICNPMTSEQLDELVDALGLEAGCHVYDAACGYGELLDRCVNRTDVRGTGIDLSPWMITAAHARSAQGNRDMRWILGDASQHLPEPAPDVVVCIGAEWVWHDFNGTARAVAERVADGGVAVIGAARLHHAADPDQVRRERGRVETVDDMQLMLRNHGLEPFHRIDPDDAGWDNYIARTARAAAAWAVDHPGPRADEWIDEQADWQAARERDRDVIGWSVWMAHKQ